MADRENLDSASRTKRVATPSFEGDPRVTASVARDLAAASLNGTELAAGRFLVKRRLGVGGMGVVYEAHDRARDQVVALKQLVRVAARGGLALKAEFRSLVGVDHPNVVRLHELFCEEEPWFFTMDLVEGVDFIRHVRWGDAPTSMANTDLSESNTVLQRRPLPILRSTERLRAALPQLVSGLQAIHAAGKLHCDIKPSNVMVTEKGELVILDFGLVTDSSAPPRLRDGHIAGTPGYIAPERFAGGRASEASDWYAVGAMVHEALTGRLPSSQHTAATFSAADLVDFDLSEQVYVRQLHALCLGLLRSAPTQRWNGEDVLAALGSRPVNKRGSGSAHARSAGQLVGRARELQRLHDALAQVRRGAAAFVCVTGESGIGKSALLAQFVSELRRSPDTVVFQNRCYERESIRYKAFDGVMDQLSAFWANLPEAEAAALLPRGVESLAQVFGVLSHVPAVDAFPTRACADVPDPGERRRAAFQALKELLTRIGDRYLQVIVIDDLQWGDAESAHELVQLLSPADAPPVLVVGAYRSSDMHETSPLRHMLAALRNAPLAYHEIALAPLNDGEAAALALSLAERPIAKSTMEQITSEARGSPFFVSELVRQTNVEGGLPDVRPRDLVAARIATLPPSERHLLELIALAPGPVRQRLLQVASGLGSLFEPAVRYLHSEGMVRTRRGLAYDLLEPNHDRIREAVIRELTPQARRAHHHSFARALMDAGEQARDVIAVHLEGCGELAAAAEHYRAAADTAYNALAFDHAAQLYERSIKLQDSTPPERDPLSTRAPPDAALRGVLLRRAEALALAGHGPRSARAYEEASKAAQGAEQNELRLRAAEQLLYAGHHQPAFKLLREVLPSFGMRIPLGPRWTLLVRLVYNALRVALSRQRRASPTAPRAALRADLYDRLADATLYIHFGLFCYFQQKHVLEGLRAEDPGRVAIALTSRALLTASPFPHRFQDVLPDLERAGELASGCGDPYVRGRVALNQGVVYSAIGRYTETLSHVRKAETIFRRECRSVTWGLQHSIAWQSVSLFYLGRFNELGELCSEHLPEALRRGDEILSKLLGIWSAWVMLAHGQPEEALQISPAIALGDGFGVLDAGALTQRGPLLLYMGRVDEAWPLYQRCEPLLRRLGVLNARARANEFYWTRGLVAAHLRTRARNAAAEALLQHDVRELLRAHTDEARAMAEHLQGNSLLAQGKRTLAAEKWNLAARHYGSCDMAAFAATLRLAGMAISEGAESQLDRRRALEALSVCGVRDAERWVQMWCPVRSEPSKLAAS